MQTETEKAKIVLKKNMAKQCRQKGRQKKCSEKEDREIGIDRERQTNTTLCTQRKKIKHTPIELGIQIYWLFLHETKINPKVPAG